MSPAELFREKTIELLSDPAKGLNPAFVENCRRRGIDVPIVGSGGDPAAPFAFTPNSNNVFRMREDIEWLSRNSNQQYPCLLIYSGPSTQSRAKRIKGSRFHGVVNLDVIAYVAWYESGEPEDSNYEALLDALEESFLFVLNSNCDAWQPVLYENLLDVRDRSPLELTNSDTLLRRSVRFALQAVISV
jgi:hypothetical protein